MRFIGLLIGLAALSACAAREVHPVSLSQAGDENLTCEQLHQQISENDAAIAPLVKHQGAVDDLNVVKVVVGGIVLAGTTDLSEHDKITARSMADRNEKLRFLAKNKGC